MHDEPTGQAPNQEAADMPRPGAVLLAAGGLAAAFGAASCCVLPLLLGAAGLGGAWLGTLGAFAAPHQALLLTGAAVLLVSSGAILWRRRAAACAPGGTCTPPAFRSLTIFILSLGAILAALSALVT